MFVVVSGCFGVVSMRFGVIFGRFGVFPRTEPIPKFRKPSYLLFPFPV